MARRGSRWYIDDLDSRNGTSVNGRRVRRRWLHVGDRLTVGEFSFRVGWFRQGQCTPEERDTGVTEARSNRDVEG
ncbi:MAG: FHA domain-containing protein [Planctomycetaceae bacterium]|nr:FHA domain-containing protein [Planctomycetaceae bacterium]